MLAMLLPIVLQLVTQAAPLLTSSATITTAIQTVAQAVPLVIETAKDLAPSVKLAIAAIRANGLITDAQLAELDAIEARLDAAYDAARDQARASDNAEDAAARAPGGAVPKTA